MWTKTLLIHHKNCHFETTRNLMSRLTPKEFVNGVFTLQMHQAFPAEEIWNHNNRQSFWICVWAKLRQRNDYHEFIVFVKFCFQNVFRPMWKRKAGVLNQISPVWRVCRKSSVFATYSKRNHGNQAAFSNSSCLVWTGPYQTYLEPLNRRKQQYSARQRFHHHSKPVRNTPPHDVHVTTVP